MFTYVRYVDDLMVRKKLLTSEARDKGSCLVWRQRSLQFF